MKTPTALCWLASLYALLLLTGCGLWRPAPTVTRTEVIAVPSIAYRPLPDALTTPIPAPPSPPLLCEWNGQAAVCVIDALATLPAWRAALEAANADRRRAAILGGSDGQ